MMRWLGVAIAVLVAGVVLFFGAVYAASELGGEVVVLHRHAPDGSADRVRVWIVEDDTGTWIEHGSADDPWIRQLAADPRLTLERRGSAATYRAAADPEAHVRYHRLRREAYGWADAVVQLATGDASACPGVPVRLDAAAD